MNKLLILLLLIAITGYILKTKMCEKDNSNNTLLDLDILKTTDLELNDKENERIVLYYAPWCGYCKDLLPIWEKLEKINNNLEKIDCAENQQAAVDNMIERFPTIIKYSSKGKEEYLGDRSYDDLSSFIKN